MHKMVNGERVELTPEEEAAWIEKGRRHEEKMAKIAAEKAAKKEQRDKLLERLGLTEAEAELLLNK